MKNKIGIVTTGYLPVPPTKGGAVEALILNYIKENEKFNKNEVFCFSIYDKKAIEESSKINNTKFIFFKSSIFAKFFDLIIYFIFKYILRKEKVNSYRHILGRLSFLKKVSRYIKKNDFDFIILENHFSEYLCLKWNKNYIKYNGKYYYHCHNVPSGTYGCKDIILKTAKFICVSNYIVSELKRSFNISDNKKFVVLRNSVDESVFKKSEKSIELRQKYRIEEDDFVILFIGRFSREKGILELLKAINCLDFKFKLLVLGSTFYAEKVKSTFEDELITISEKCEDKIIFTGYINHNEVANYYSLADICVLPSMWNDPAPLTIIEAMKCGLPIVTTYSGGIPEYVNKDNAIILERNNDTIVNSLVEAIIKLKNDFSLREKMAKSSLKISENLTLVNYYNCLNSILDERN